MPTHSVHFHLRLGTGSAHVPIKDVAARCCPRTTVSATIPCYYLILVVVIILLR